MARLRFLLVFPVAAAAAACIPERDNPSDPKVAPVARLSISPQEGTRATLFTLDASASSGGPGTRRYRWDLDDDPATFERDTGTLALTTALLGIPTGALGDEGTGTWPREVRVEVRSANTRSVGSVVVPIRNRAPELLDSFELTASAWTGATVSLDVCGGRTPCSSVDADGDVPSYLWESIGATAVTLSSNTASRVTFTAPLAPQPLYFQLTAFDGLAKTRSFGSVRVGSVGWATSVSPERFYRVRPDAGFVTWRQGMGPFDSLHALAGGFDGSVWTGITVLSGSTYDVTRRTADGAVTTVWDVPLPPAKLAAANDTGCALLGGGSDEIYALAPAVSGTTGVFTAIDPNLTGLPHDVFADSSGEGACLAWAGASLYRIFSDGTFENLLDAGFGRRTALAADGVAWSLDENALFPTLQRHSIPGLTPPGLPLSETPLNALAITPLGVDGVLLLADDAGTVRAFRAFPRGPDEIEAQEITVPTFPSDLDTQIVGFPDGNVWANAPGEQILRRFVVRPDSLELLEEVEPFTEPFPGGFGRMSHAPDLGGVVIESADKILRLADSSSLDAVPPPSAIGSPRIVANPATGGLWMISLENGTSVLRVDAAGRVLGETPISTTDIAIRARRDGGLAVATWIFGETDSRFLYLSADGTIQDVEDVIPDSGGVSDFAVGVDGRVACAENGLDGFVLQDGAVTATVSIGEMFARPVAAGDGACWFANYFSTSIDRVSPPGVVSSVPIEAADMGPAHDGGIWVLETGGEVRHISPAGVIGPPLSVGGVSSSRIQIERGCAPGTGTAEDCDRLWFADGNVLRCFSGTGELLATYSAPDPFGTGFIETMTIGH